MDDLSLKLKGLLEAAFPPPSGVRLQDGQGLIGVVTSGVFLGKDDVSRQRMVWDALNKGLDAGEKRRIAIVVAVTPEEEAAHTATVID